MEEKDPGLPGEQSTDSYTNLIHRWLDGLGDSTAQMFKQWMIEKIHSIPRIKSEGNRMIELAQGRESKIWIKKLSDKTKKWIAQYPYLSRWSVMTNYDDGYS